MLQLGYITNGLADVDAVAAIELLCEIGYYGVGFTLDHGLLNPFKPDFRTQLDRTAESLQQFGMRSVIETGARFLLDPEVKHEPSLVTADPAGQARRIDFLCRAIDAAAGLRSECVSLWSGFVRDGAGDHDAMDCLTSGLAAVLEYAEIKSVRLAFEPEPGMLIDTLDRYADLLTELDSRGVETSRLLLTIDVGHLHCQDELPIPAKIREWAPRLVNVHLEDMRRGVHEHLMFGEGEIEFPPVIAALNEIGYAGLIGVELSRHTHCGPQAARQAYNFLAPLCQATGS